MTVTLTGAGAAPGIAVARPFVIAHVASAIKDPGPLGPPEAEKRRLHQAMAQAARELYELADRVRAAAGDEAEIFEAHAAFAEDPELELRADELIDAGHSAIAATIAAFAAFRQLLASSTSEYLAARAADLDDVCARVTAILAGIRRHLDLPEEPSVLLARELTPSQTAEMPRERIAAVVTETGSPTSHAAILARTLGIPAVVGVTRLLDLAAGAALVAVDGRSGEVHLDPDDALLAALLDRQAGERARQAELASARHAPSQTADGVRIELVANIAGRDDLVAAKEAGAEGAGLVRTELLFQDRRSEPSVEEQAAYYGEVLDAFAGQRVVFRTLDIGADKPMPFFTRPPEPNPALGLRGIRLSLRHPKLFEGQLRALVRAYGERSSSGQVRMGVMFPLVSRVEEVTAARAELARVAEDEAVDVTGIEVGVMIEVPSAALAAARIAPHIDFFSIGTNDLLQYLFAADRLGAEVAELADICEPVVLDLVAHVVAAATQSGAWVGVCGETASDPIVGAAFVGLGVRELSMVAGAIGEVKDLLGHHTLSALAAAADAARCAPSATAARVALAAALT
jgi:phosphotransferase system enzyme I (PtsI)